MLTGTITSFCTNCEDSLESLEIDGAYLRWKLEHFRLDSAQKIRPESVVELLDFRFVQDFMLLFQVL